MTYVRRCRPASWWSCSGTGCTSVRSWMRCTWGSIADRHRSRPRWAHTDSCTTCRSSLERHRPSPDTSDSWTDTLNSRNNSSDRPHHRQPSIQSYSSDITPLLYVSSHFLGHKAASQSVQPFLHGWPVWWPKHKHKTCMHHGSSRHLALLAVVAMLANYSVVSSQRRNRRWILMVLASQIQFHQSWQTHILWTICATSTGSKMCKFESHNYKLITYLYQAIIISN